MALRKHISVPFAAHELLEAREKKVSLAKSIALKMAASAAATEVCVTASANIMCGRTYGQIPGRAVDPAKAIVYMLPNEQTLLQATAWREYSLAAVLALGGAEAFAERANGEGPAWLHPPGKSRKRKAGKEKDKNDDGGGGDDDDDEGEDLAETAEADDAEMLDANDDFSAREML